MRIVRYRNAEGSAVYGVESSANQARRIKSELYASRDGWQIAAENEPIVERLAAVDPVNILCIGLNYREHATESGMEFPKNPVLFMKPTSSVAAPNQPILIPKCCDAAGEVDYECELAVVIGKAAHNVSEADALDYVFGYTCANDVSARKWQMNGGGNQWIRGKSFDTFCPLGPVLVTADEIRDPQGLAIRTILNGEVVQDHTTADMIFSVRQLIAYLSQDATLLPGTVILTGTPQGVGFARKPPLWLKGGDHVVVEIEGIGKLENPVQAA
ncbi:MAG: fumarylacetoacetate hydrolase family protein [Pirellulaceae bacterium]|nr:fumarylacetoacetate hydrolase family protein [Planctomycetales bacterium]